MSTLPVFEHLQTHHNRQDFDCGKPALNQFLQRQVRQNADRNVGVTHVAVSEAGSQKVLAYYTLLIRVVDAGIVPSKKLPKGEIGVVLLGRLAVDRSAQGQGLGKVCLLRGIAQVESAAREIGIHALVVDALDEEASTWYLRLDLGFQTLLDDPNHLYLTVETIRQISGG